MTNLSVVIITFNEQQNIARCLDSIAQVADDVVVVDSYSTDETESICKQYGVNFIQRKWEGYSLQKNFGNLHAKYDWILSLDADEALSEELISSIKLWKNQNNPVPASFKRLTNYCGTWIRHSGWYPDIKTRIFNRITAKWEGEIHEHLAFNSAWEIDLLKGDCLHYSYYSLQQHKDQALKFSKLWAASRYAEGRKSSWLKILVKPMATFLKAFVIHFGFLDGTAGFTIAKISAHAAYLRYKMLYDLNRHHNIK